MAVLIKAVEAASPAAVAGLRGGMLLVAIDGNPVHDGLDYEFYSTGANPLLLVEEDGQQREVRVEKPEYQPLGCQFESYLIDGQHPCKNRCVFCFIDQLPQGMRSSLYFKDDDERLGFLFGNYITLTNLSEREVERIIAMRFSPVNISVHTVNPELRVRMMGNKNAGKVLDIIPRLAAAGIAMNFQLVLCPGWNDGEELRRSIDWLAGLGEAVGSIAAVPVGLTCHRQGLPSLQSYTRETADEQLDIMLAAGDALVCGGRPRLVYPSDEWFLLAGRPIPEADFYDGYPQLENGVGMWRVLLDEFEEALAEAPGGPQRAEADIAVGTLAAPLFVQLSEMLREKYPHAALHVHAVENCFFGPGVTVTGLLTGQDLLAQLAGKVRSGRLFLPEDTLRAEGDAMLDDTSPEALAEGLGVQVEVLPKGGEVLLAALLDDEPD